MKAVICHRYGGIDQLEYKEVPTPEPGPKEVRVKISYTTVTAGDCELRAFSFGPSWWVPVRLAMGITKPRNNILGQEYSGIVDAIGEKVTAFKVGDEVFGSPGMKLGGYAQYLCQKAGVFMAKVPEGVGLKQAATITTGGLNALHFLRKANVQKGERVLIIGAGGSIGTYGLQYAMHLGAVVDCIDSADKLNMLKEAGANKTIDYRKEDVRTLGQKYDVIFDVAGMKDLRSYASLLNDGGRYLDTNPTIRSFIQGRLTRKDIIVIAGLAGETPQDLSYLASLISKGVLNPLIDQLLPLSEMKQAHTYVDAGKKKGHLLIDVNK